MLTLGIGLCGTVVLLGVLDSGFRDLPVPEGHEVVQVQVRDARARPLAPPAPIGSWTDAPALDAVGALRTFQATVSHPDAPAVRVGGAAMHPSALRLLEVRPALGRLPTDGVEDEGAVLLGFSTWQSMGAEPGLVGAEVAVDGRSHTVVGVMPEGFGFPERHGLWTVLPATDGGEAVVARLANGVGTERAASEIRSRLEGIALPEDVAHPLRVEVLSWTAGRGEGGEAAALGGLAVLVALLLLVCAANVATLLMVRAVERTRALTVHAALGAPRYQVGLQLFAEALLIAIAGGMLGLATGYVVLGWMQANLAEHWGYYWMTMEVRPSVVAGTAGAVLLVAIVAGTAPAVRAMRVDLRGVLADAGRGGTGGPRGLGRWFVGAQVALSTMGLIAAAYLGAGLVDSRDQVARLPLDRVALGVVTLPEARYPDPDSRAALVRRLREEAGRLPDVRAVGLSGAIPGFELAAGPLRVALEGEDSEGSRRLSWIAADPGLPDTYGVGLLRGRGFTAADDLDAPPVALVTASFDRRHLEGQGPGARLRVEPPGEAPYPAEVVGVVEDWYPADAGGRAEQVLLPLAQVDPARLYLSVRTAGPADAVVGDLREVVARVDRELALEMPRTLESLMAWLLRMPRVMAAFGALGGVVGVLVAGVGLYGLVAYQVRARIADLGVRMALGADSSRIAGEVVRTGLGRLLPGLAVGLLLGGAAVTVLRTLVEGATRWPSSLLLAGVVAGMLLTGLLASLVPAVRASRLEPARVLRRE